MDPLSGPPKLSIERADPDVPDVSALIAAHIARSRKYYPEDSCHTFDPAAMTASGTQLFVGRVDGQAVAIGGIKPLGPDAAELKSMHTLKAWRGHGFARRIVEHLISVAESEGWRSLYLETGSDEASAAARALYAKFGFVLCPPFGDYTSDPLSVFMRRGG